MTPVHDVTYGRPLSAYGTDCPPERVAACAEEMECSAHRIAKRMLLTLFAVDIDDPESVEEFQNRRRRDADLHRLIEKAMTGTLWTVAKMTAAILLALAALHLKEIMAWFGKP
ncbi:MAG: hypothetical protein WCE38_26000 [Burkholderiales bacterium]